jgi:membrane protease YdiL (CAAX protease family)
MLDLYDHALALILIVALPPRAWLAFRRLTRASPADRPRVRQRLYLAAMITQWGLVALLALHWILRGRTRAELGLVPVLTPGAIGIAGGALVIATLILLQLRGGMHGEARDRARARLVHVEALLPHSPAELSRFRLVAITAGICEELMFRGFLIWYFAHFMGLIQAALLSSLFFGIGHIYQGPRYVIVTGLVGVFMGGVYLLSGSLVLPIAIHALMDLYSGWVGYKLFAGDPESGTLLTPPPSEPIT